ncbi:unnamed protein product [Cylicocyclus nassatus]|uniref:Uncharacterized protein n=1 Tax=Cylicocyclus nassatus TaxID=53992 RepID=A0AA36DL49_CYLNA|nr:unnamed protein product [Cylicocyclus nassatus]
MAAFLVAMRFDNSFLGKSGLLLTVLYKSSPNLLGIAPTLCNNLICLLKYYTRSVTLVVTSILLINFWALSALMNDIAKWGSYDSSITERLNLEKPSSCSVHGRKDYLFER